MDIEKLDILFSSYGYLAKERNEKVCVYVLNQGMYHGAEILSLDDSKQTEIYERYLNLGYSTRVQHFKDEGQAEDYLFNGFFSTQNTECEITRRYNDFAEKQVRHYGNSNIKYAYINMPFNLYSDTCNDINGNPNDVINTIMSELDKKGAHLVIVEAAAGFGKTCTAYELYNQFKNKSQKVKPVFAELYMTRDARQFKYILGDVIDKEKDTNAKQDLFIYNIKKGRIPLIIDGFDELLSKDIDSGKLEKPNEFEQVETMLSTIGELLVQNSKIILTTRKTAIFSGPEFSKWVDSYNGNFDVVRIQLEKPNVKEWLSRERYESIESKNVPLSSISNPVLLTYLRNIDIEEFNKLLEKPDLITKKYFEHLLNREKERQFISIRWEEQMVIYENLAHAFLEFDITGESRSFVKELLVEYNKPKLLYYRESMSTKQTLDELADTLTNHALLDRVGNKDNISFVNEFIFGYLLGKSIIKDKIDFLNSQKLLPEYLIELAINAYRYTSEEEKNSLWDNLDKIKKKMSLSLSVQTDTLLKNKLCQSLCNAGLTSLHFENVSLGGADVEIKDTSFVDTEFENCHFLIKSFNNVIFTGCTFKNCSVYNDIQNKNYNIHCYGCEDFNSGFVNEFVSQTKVCNIPVSVKEDIEIEILGKYFKVDGKTPKMKYISSIRKDFEHKNIEEVFEVFDSLCKRGLIVTSGNNSYIRPVGISYYHKNFQ